MIPTTGVLLSALPRVAPRDIRAYITPLQWCTLRVPSELLLSATPVVHQDALK